MGKYFGTDGFRGKAGVDLTSEHAYKIGRYLGNYYSRNGRRGRIVIGKDTRLSSYMYESSLISGIVASVTPIPAARTAAFTSCPMAWPSISEMFLSTCTWRSAWIVPP